MLESETLSSNGQDLSRREPRPADLEFMFLRDMDFPIKSKRINQKSPSCRTRRELFLQFSECSKRD